MSLRTDNGGGSPTRLIFGVPGSGDRTFNEAPLTSKRKKRGHSIFLS